MANNHLCGVKIYGLLQSVQKMETYSRSNRKKRFAGNLVNARDQLYYYALQLTENKEDAKDLVQETSLKALKNYRHLKDDQHQNSWLYTILKNTYINNLRSGHNRNMRSYQNDPEGISAFASLPERDCPDRIFDRKELNDRIRCLPPANAKPLRLHMAGYAYKEISRMTGVPIGTVKSRIHVAKRKLKDCYRDCH